MLSNNFKGQEHENIKKLIENNPGIFSDNIRMDNPSFLQHLMNMQQLGNLNNDAFKDTAMLFARYVADITQPLFFNGKQSTLLHFFVLNNKKGEHNQAIAELIEINKELLNVRNKSGHTAVHALLVKDPNVSVEAVESLVSDTNLHYKDRLVPKQHSTFGLIYFFN